MVPQQEEVEEHGEGDGDRQEPPALQQPQQLEAEERQDSGHDDPVRPPTGPSGDVLWEVAPSDDVPWEDASCWRRAMRRCAADQVREGVLQSPSHHLEIPEPDLPVDEVADRGVGIERVEGHLPPADVYVGDALEPVELRLVGHVHGEAESTGRGHCGQGGPRTIGHHLPPVHHHDPGGVLHLVQVVRGVDHGAAALAEVADRPPQRPPRLYVHRHRGFVQEEELGPAGDRQSEPNELRLPPGEAVGAPGEERRDTGAVGQGLHAFGTRVQAAHHPEHGGDRDTGRQPVARRLLQHDPHQAAGSGLARGQPKNLDRAGVRT